MRIMALDLGTKVGVARANDFGPGWAIGTWDLEWLPGWRPGEKRQLAKRPEKLAAFLTRLVIPKRTAIDLVVYERPFARGLHATRMLWGMAGVVEAWAADNGLPVLDVLPTTIKKWATGSGKATKRDMIAKAAALGYPGLNEHEADALLLGMYAGEKAIKGVK